MADKTRRIDIRVSESELSRIDSLALGARHVPWRIRLKLSARRHVSFSGRYPLCLTGLKEATFYNRLREYRAAKSKN